MRKKVLLVYPGRTEKQCPTFPLSLLYLGAAVRKAGYPVDLLDLRVDDRKIDFSDIFCVGISSMTGAQIKYGLKFAQDIRQINKDIPIIWGGIHPTMMPDQTVSDPLVDFVVRNEGDETLVELIQCLEKKWPLNNVRGLTFKLDDSIVDNPERDFINLDNIDIELPYNLLKLDRYQHLQSGSFLIQTSRGCPHRCGYCYNTSFNQSRYRSKNYLRVLDEIEYIVQTFGPRHIQIIDDNFFTDRERVRKICQGIIERNLTIKWTATCRIDYILNFDHDFIKLLEASGCFRLSIGAESGSNKILQMIYKDITREQILAGFKKLSSANISLDVTFMCGFPQELVADTKETFSLIDEIRKINSKALITAIYVFTPYPGTSLYEKVICAYGFQPPVTLRDWAQYKINLYPENSWLTRKQKDFYANLSILSRFPFYSQNYEIPPHIRQKALFKTLAFSARMRWRYKFFRFPLEWRVVRYYLEQTRGYV